MTAFLPPSTRPHAQFVALAPFQRGVRKLRLEVSADMHTGECGTMSMILAALQSISVAVFAKVADAGERDRLNFGLSAMERGRPRISRGWVCPPQ